MFAFSTSLLIELIDAASDIYQHAAINWDEFWQVVKGHGPMNKERMKARVGAWDGGEWVRDAAMAYADKKEERKIAKSS